MLSFLTVLRQRNNFKFELTSKLNHIRLDHSFDVLRTLFYISRDWLLLCKCIQCVLYILLLLYAIVGLITLGTATVVFKSFNSVHIRSY